MTGFYDALNALFDTINRALKLTFWTVWKGGGMETESALKHGLLLFNKGINYTFELLITIRIGMEMLF